MALANVLLANVLLATTAHFNREVGTELRCVNGLNVMYFHIFKKSRRRRRRAIKNMVSAAKMADSSAPAVWGLVSRFPATESFCCQCSVTTSCFLSNAGLVKDELTKGTSTHRDTLAHTHRDKSVGAPSASGYSDNFPEFPAPPQCPSRRTAGSLSGRLIFTPHSTS